jgi:putative membrane protein
LAICEQDSRWASEGKSGQAEPTWLPRGGHGLTFAECGCDSAAQSVSSLGVCCAPFPQRRDKFGSEDCAAESSMLPVTSCFRLFAENGKISPITEALCTQPQERTIMSPLADVLFALLAQEHWRPENFGMAVLSVVVFTLIGIVMSVFGFKIWDRITPGNLEEEICKKQNMAAALLGAAIILGTCIVVAAAMIG